MCACVPSGLARRRMWIQDLSGRPRGTTFTASRGSDMMTTTTEKSVAKGIYRACILQCGFSKQGDYQILNA